MRKVMILAIVTMVVTLAGIQVTEALDVNIQAFVPGTCRFASAGPVTVSFPGLTFNADGTLAAATVSDSTSVEYWCTKGHVGFILDADGTAFTGGNTGVINSSLSFNTDTIDYNYTFTDGVRDPADGPLVKTSITVQADIADGTAFNGGTGTYTDTVILTITP